MQIVGEAVHSGRVLNDPVEEICQRRDVARCRPMRADGCGAHAPVRIQAQQCHKQCDHCREMETEREKERERQKKCKLRFVAQHKNQEAYNPQIKREMKS